MFPPEKEAVAAISAAEEDLEQSVDGVRSFDDNAIFATPSVTSSALARRTKQAWLKFSSSIRFQPKAANLFSMSGVKILSY